MRIRVPFGLAKRAVCPRRRNGKAQAERRKQTLGESSDIENRLGTIQSLQRVQRAAAKAELRVVVVLDDDSSARMREFQQRRPTSRRHRTSERKLMRRCYADHRRIGREALHHQSLSIHWRGDDFRSRGRKGRAHRR